MTAAGTTSAVASLGAVGDTTTGLQMHTSGPFPCAELSPLDQAEVRDWLLAEGATEEDIAHAGGDPARVAVDLAIRQGESLSARHIAERHGVEPSRITGFFQMSGVTVRDIDQVRFTELDAEFINIVQAAGVLDAADGRALMRAVATALDRVAEAAVAFYVQGTEARLEIGRAHV